MREKSSHNAGGILVTGASGFLGSAVAGAVAAEGMPFHALHHRRAISPLPGMTILDGGTRSLNAELLDRCGTETVIHCARPVLPRLRRPGRMLAAQLAASDNRFLLKQAEQTIGKPRILFASGSLVYGSGTGPVTEETPLNPLSYSREYHAGEVPLERAARAGKSVMILRFPWILGNGSWFRWFYLEPLKRTGTVPLFGTGENRMMFIGVDDAARFMLHAGRSEKAGGILNVVTPHVMTQREFAGLVAERFGGRVADHRELFPRAERAVREAFTSDIVLKTNYPEYFRDFSFRAPSEILKDLIR